MATSINIGKAVQAKCAVFLAFGEKNSFCDRQMRASYSCGELLQGLGEVSSMQGGASHVDGVAAALPMPGQVTSEKAGEVHLTTAMRSAQKHAPCCWHNQRSPCTPDTNTTSVMASRVTLQGALWAS